MKIIYKSAVFSPCRTWRYVLNRRWDLRPVAMFIGLNCSTADETQDDPTVRRCIGYAHAWGYGGLVMTNLFAFRATDPRVMKVASDPVGPSNDQHLRVAAISVVSEGGIVIAAWGNHGAYQGRSREVVELMGRIVAPKIKLMCLRVTKAGQPQHPLYLPKDLGPVPFP